MSRCRRPCFRPKRPGYAWLAALLIALLYSQSIGLLHRIVHAAALEQPRSPDAGRAGEQAGSLDRLFANHAAAHSLCLVFDHISHPSPLPATPVSSDAAPPPAIAPVQAPAERLFGATRVPFQARGPPLRS